MQSASALERSLGEEQAVTVRVIELWSFQEKVRCMVCACHTVSLSRIETYIIKKSCEITIGC